MPTYEYRCAACAHEFEQYQSITVRPLRKCPACGARALQRLIGAGGGIIFKGSGFHQTDYRSESYRKAAEADHKPASPPSDSKDGGAKPSDAKKAASGEKKAAPTSEGKKRGKKSPPSPTT
jgi:putative FmdB family regulatory protein